MNERITAAVENLKQVMTEELAKALAEKTATYELEGGRFNMIIVDGFKFHVIECGKSVVIHNNQSYTIEGGIEEAAHAFVLENRIDGYDKAIAELEKIREALKEKFK